MAPIYKKNVLGKAKIRISIIFLKNRNYGDKGGPPFQSVNVIINL